MIAFALATNTSLLVLDEPTNGLDIPSKVQFRKLVARALGEDRCVIISTHQVRDLDPSTSFPSSSALAPRPPAWPPRRCMPSPPCAGKMLSDPTTRGLIAKSI
uniref:Uncharacterized protein n=1 Tax=Tanacetum cinerariifolium TaxID=118510 RepID=A0A699UBE1_TANCI|nr:hypothetical protein [Tanacetum cinerariifolium]